MTPDERAKAPQLPIGTQVVTREAIVDPAGVVQRGATGRVVAAGGDDTYVVRLATGREFPVRRAQLGLRRAYQSEIGVGEPSAAVGHALVAEHTILACVVGSRAFGLATDESDTDTRGVYVAPTASYWNLVKPPAHVEGPQPERFSWEVERFCELALKANPNMLEVLHAPERVVLTALGEELLEMRGAFLSQLVYQTFSGYVLGQFKKIESDLRRDGVPKWKHVMHLLRLLLSAGELLRSGELHLDVGAHRERLLAVRFGAESWESVDAWRHALHARLDEALESTPLPAAPDVRRIDNWLYDVRCRSALEGLS